MDKNTTHLALKLQVESASIVAHHLDDQSVDSTSATDQHVSTLRKWLLKIKGDIHATDDPRQYPQAKKNLIVFIVALSGLYGPISTLIYVPGMLQMAKDLDASIEAINATMSAYIALAGLSPLFWSSISDAYGRRPVYIISISIGIVASILCASSKNIATLIVFRALQASGASSGQTLGAGSIADVFDVAERGKAFGVFFIGPLLGPSIGPLIGGILCEFRGWQSSFYFVAEFGGCILVLVTFFLPETVRRERPVPRKSSLDIKAVNTNSIRSTFTPLVTMLSDLSILVMTLYGTILFASLFVLNPTITDTFKTLYNYNAWQVGLSYLCLGGGLVVGSVISGIYSDRVIKDLRKKLGPENVYPELRLKTAYPSFILVPAGYLIYAWTTEKHVGVYGPLFGLFIYAIGQMFAMTSSSIYYVDSKPGRSASAVAINNCIRSLAAAVVTIFSTTWVRSMGPGKVFTILAAISIVNTTFVLLVKLYGRKWRMDFEKRMETASVLKNNSINEDDSIMPDVDEQEKV
ncbi:major facilitator superfamily domain-containing protein [Parasitella parasitica]|nr:major facilitator superfamily domain-containing protein [Parasitella parasitica]